MISCALVPVLLVDIGIALGAIALVSLLRPLRFLGIALGYAKAAMNFLWSDDNDGWTRLSTATRVAATSPGARRRFAAYWRLIYPGSAFRRRAWLDAIRRRAEAAASPISPAS